MKICQVRCKDSDFLTVYRETSIPERPLNTPEIRLSMIPGSILTRLFSDAHIYTTGQERQTVLLK